MEDTPDTRSNPALVGPVAQKSTVTTLADRERARAIVGEPLPPDATKKRRVWICIQASGPDGMIAHEGDLSLEIYLDHWHLERYQKDLEVVTKQIQDEQWVADKMRQKVRRSLKRSMARKASKKAPAA